jgi:hypothetical protein
MPTRTPRVARSAERIVTDEDHDVTRAASELAAPHGDPGGSGELRPEVRSCQPETKPMVRLGLAVGADVVTLPLVRRDRLAQHQAVARRGGDTRARCDRGSGRPSTNDPQIEIEIFGAVERRVEASCTQHGRATIEDNSRSVKRMLLATKHHPVEIRFEHRRWRSGEHPTDVSMAAERKRAFGVRRDRGEARDCARPRARHTVGRGT